MGNSDDINGEISRTLMGKSMTLIRKFEAINGKTRTLVGNLEEFNGKFRGH